MAAKTREDALTPMLLIGFVLVVSLLFFRGNYTLFHTFAELFTALVALIISSIAWHTRRVATSDYLTFVGMASLSVGIATILHALSYRGMPLLPEYDSNLPTTLWVVARSLQASAFLLATRFVRRKLRRPDVVVTAYAGVATALVIAALNHTLPAAYVEGVGLTPFKIGMEYTVIAVTLAAGMALWRRREDLDRFVLRCILGSMAATVAAELAFTLYSDPFGPVNRLGHIAHLVAFALLYLGLVRASLEIPYDTLFRTLRERERELTLAYREEHDVAETLQQAMAIDPQSVEGLDLAHRYLPAPGAGRVGGDFYDLFTLDDRLVAFTIGDVCGKGIEAAATTLKARAAIRATALTESDPATVLERVNTYLHHELDAAKFVTAVFGTVDTRSGLVTMAIAGHPDPIVCGRVELGPPDDVRRQPLGVLPRLGAINWSVQLAPGESLVLVTDGVTEAPGNGGRFGAERLHELLSALVCWESAEDVVCSVVSTLHRHASEHLDDDVAVVALRYQPRERESLLVRGA